MTYLIPISISIISFALGYWYAKQRYMVKETLGMLKIMTAYIKGEISVEQAKEQINQLTPNI